MHERKTNLYVVGVLGTLTMVGPVLMPAEYCSLTLPSYCNNLPVADQVHDHTRDFPTSQARMSVTAQTTASSASLPLDEWRYGAFIVSTSTA